MNRKKNRIYNINRFIISIIIMVVALIGFISLTNRLIDTYAETKEPISTPQAIVTETAIIVEQENVTEQAISIPEYDISLDTGIQRFIYEECEKYNLSYEFVLAIIWQESKMDTNAVNFNNNKSKDSGLMQVNSEIMYQLASELEIENFDPYNQYHNLQVGIYYLNTLQDNFSEICNEEDAFKSACLGYNIGGNKVKNLIEQNGTGILDNYNYVSKVLEYKSQLEQFGKFN